MAQELVVNTWCDVCLADGQHEPGEVVSVSLDGRPPRLLDLCERDRKTYVAPLAELLESLGRRVDGKPSRARSERAAAPAEAAPAEAYACPLCGAPNASRDTLGKHVNGVHGFTMTELYGPTCPVCGEPGGGTHIGRAHGAMLDSPGLVGAFRWAEANGDPHGVAAETRARWAAWAAR